MNKMKTMLALATVSAGLGSTITAGLMNNINILPVVAIALATFATASLVAILTVVSSK